jgi:HAD superfamily hydrolase (TIGR01509 family)
MRAVLFDFDGVLVDSEPLHFQALRDALLPEAIVIDEEVYAREYLAQDDRGAIRTALAKNGRACDLARMGAIQERKARCFETLMPRVSFFPGARELVRALEREVPLAIASGALTSEIEALLAAGGLRDAFSAVVGADQVRQGKPHPEPYLTAMTRLLGRATGLRPEQCLVVEDSMPGIAAALSAGMKVVAVTNSYPAAKLSAAHRVVDSLAELTPASLRELFA